MLISPKPCALEQFRVNFGMLSNSPNFVWLNCTKSEADQTIFTEQILRGDAHLTKPAFT